MRPAWWMLGLIGFVLTPAAILAALVHEAIRAWQRSLG